MNTKFTILMVLFNNAHPIYILKIYLIVPPKHNILISHPISQNNNDLF